MLEEEDGQHVEHDKGPARDEDSNDSTIDGGEEEDNDDDEDQGACPINLEK